MITDQQIVDALPTLMKYAMKFTRDRCRAQDLVQDTVVRILEARDRYTEQGDFIGWAYVIMRNLMYNYSAGRNPRFRPTIQIETMENKLAAAGNQEARDQLQDVQRAWAKLPAKMAATVWPVIEGVGYAEVAAALGIKPGTVKSRVSRARAELRAAMG